MKSSIGRNLTRAAIMLGIAAAAMPLSGCIAAAIPSESEVSSSPSDDAPSTLPSESSEPTDGTDSDPLASDTLTFEEGASLSSSAVMQWSDGLMMDEGWTVLSSDDGNGNWSYETVDGSCDAAFWQGYITDVDTSSADDRVISDNVLAAILDADVSQVTAVATDTHMGYQFSGELGLDARSVSGQDESWDWQAFARGFAATQSAVTLIVDCYSGASAADAAAEIFAKSPILATF